MKEITEFVTTSMEKGDEIVLSLDANDELDSNANGLPNVRGRTRGRDRLCPTRNVTPVGRGAGTETEEAYNERNHRICDNQHGKRR